MWVINAEGAFDNSLIYDKSSKQINLKEISLV